MDSPTKICRSCGDTFQIHVERCPDCGTTLEVSEISPGGTSLPFQPPQAVPEGYALGPESLPEDDEVMTLGVHGEPGDIRDISVLLSQERIRHWLIAWDVQDVLAAYNKPHDYLEVYILPEDMERASALVRRHVWGEAHEGQGSSPKAPTPQAETCCPACSSALPAENVKECPECGLGLGG